MRQPENLPAFCRVPRNGRPLIGIMWVTFGHLRECRQQHAVPAGKDPARRDSDLHKCEFPD